MPRSRSRSRNRNQSLRKKKKRGSRSPCWSGYRQYGMKNKNGRQVPNCVAKTRSRSGTRRRSRSRAKSRSREKSRRGTKKVKMGIVGEIDYEMVNILREVENFRGRYNGELENGLPHGMGMMQGRINGARYQLTGKWTHGYIIAGELYVTNHFLFRGIFSWDGGHLGTWFYLNQAGYMTKFFGRSDDFGFVLDSDRRAPAEGVFDTPYIRRIGTFTMVNGMITPELVTEITQNAITLLEFERGELEMEDDFDIADLNEHNSDLNRRINQYGAREIGRFYLFIPRTMTDYLRIMDAADILAYADYLSSFNVNTPLDRLEAAVAEIPRVFTAYMQERLIIDFTQQPFVFDPNNQDRHNRVREDIVLCDDMNEQERRGTPCEEKCEGDDPITLQPYDENSIKYLINNRRNLRCADPVGLANWLEQNPTDPLSRQRFSPRQVRRIRELARR